MTSKTLYVLISRLFFVRPNYSIQLKLFLCSFIWLDDPRIGILVIWSFDSYDLGIGISPIKRLMNPGRISVARPRFRCQRVRDEIANDHCFEPSVRSFVSSWLMKTLVKSAHTGGLYYHTWKISVTPSLIMAHNIEANGFDFVWLSLAAAE